MGEYAAIAIWAGLGAGVAFVLALFHVRVPPRRAPPVEPTVAVDLAQALGQFQLQAALIVCLGFLALVLSAWAAGIGALGRAGLGVSALIAAPLLVGCAYLMGRTAVHTLTAVHTPTAAPSQGGDGRETQSDALAEQAPSPEDPA